jgi:hypothetical protein
VAVFQKQRPRVPDDLAKFEPKRWIREALDDDDEYLRSVAKCHTRPEVLKHPYALFVIAPARYRQALRNALGDDDGDAYFMAAGVHQRAYQFVKRAGSKNVI